HTPNAPRSKPPPSIRLVERTFRSPTLHSSSQRIISNRPQHNRRPQGKSQRTICSIHSKITNHSHPRIQSTRNQREKKIRDRKTFLPLVEQIGRTQTRPATTDC